MSTKGMADEIKEAMRTLAVAIEEAASKVRDGYYDDDAQRAVNSARRETLSDVASAIARAFGL